MPASTPHPPPENTPVPDAPGWLNHGLPETADNQWRKLGSWVLRAWFYDPDYDDYDDPDLTPPPPPSWWWSLCLEGVDEWDAGAEAPGETLIWIAGERCDSAEEGRRLAFEALQTWLQAQAELVKKALNEPKIVEPVAHTCMVMEGAATGRTLCGKSMSDADWVWDWERSDATCPQCLAER